MLVALAAAAACLPLFSSLMLLSPVFSCLCCIYMLSSSLNSCVYMTPHAVSSLLFLRSGAGGSGGVLGLGREEEGRRKKKKTLCKHGSLMSPLCFLCIQHLSLTHPSSLSLLLPACLSNSSTPLCLCLPLLPACLPLTLSL